MSIKHVAALLTAFCSLGANAANTGDQGTSLVLTGALDQKAMCIYQGKAQSEGAVIKMEGINMVCTKPQNKGEPLKWAVR